MKKLKLLLLLLIPTLAFSQTSTTPAWKYKTTPLDSLIAGITGFTPYLNSIPTMHYLRANATYLDTNFFKGSGTALDPIKVNYKAGTGITFSGPFLDTINSSGGGATTIYSGDGSISGNRTVSIGSNNLLLGEPGNTGLIYLQGGVQTHMQSQRVSGGPIALFDASSSGINSTAIVQVEDVSTGHTQGINLFSSYFNSPIQVIDGTANTGMIYGGNYGANFVARSLVDKGYVDSVTTSHTSIGVNGLNGTANIGLGGTVTNLYTRIQLARQISGTILTIGDTITSGGLNISEPSNGGTIINITGQSDSTTYSTGYFTTDGYINTIGAATPYHTTYLKLDTNFAHFNNGYYDLTLGDPTGNGGMQFISGTNSNLFQVYDNNFDFKTSTSGTEINAYDGEVDIYADNTNTSYLQLYRSKFDFTARNIIGSKIAFLRVDTTNFTLQNGFNQGFTGLTVNDALNSKGLAYSGNYEAHFTSKSLVDKRYVDSVATGGGSGVTSVSGTTNRITSTGGTTPVIDISASYVGQSSITMVGTLSSGSIPYSLLTGTPTIPVAANPTATAGTSFVNGTAATFMRSDAAPKVDSTLFQTVLNFFPKADIRYYTKTASDAKYQLLSNLETTVTNSTTLYPSGSAVETYVTGLIPSTPSLQSVATVGNSYTGQIQAQNFLATGTANAGYLELITQSSSPASVTNHLRIYADSVDRLSWKNSTYRRTIQVPYPSDYTVRMPYLVTGTTLEDSSYSRNTYVPLTRTLTAGTGINTIGDLSANRIINADTTVLRTVANSYSLAGMQTKLNNYAPIASPTFTGTVIIPTPFTLGATSVTSTGTQLNYLNAAAGTTGTTSTNLVYSTSPTLITPVLGAATATSINGLNITSTAGTLTIPNNASAILQQTGNFTLNLTATANSTPTFPTGTGTLAYLGGTNTWTGGQTVSNILTNVRNSINSTSTDGINIQNNTASTSGSQVQVTPRINFLGHVWNTTSVAADNQYNWKLEARGVAGTTPTSSFYLSSSLTTNSTTSFTDRVSIDNSGNLTLPTGTLTTQHLIGNTSAPTIAAGTGAGTSPTISVSGNDIAQKVTITTGTSPTVSATVATVTFNIAYGAAPKVILTPVNSAASALNGTAQVYVDDASAGTGSYVIKVGSGGLVGSTTYLFYAQVIQ